MRAMFFLSCVQLLAALCTYPMVVRVLPVSLWKTDAQLVCASLNDGFGAFLSTISASLYITSVTFILGLVSSRETVGIYGVSSRVVFAVSSVWTPLQQVVYPKVSALIHSGESAAARALQHRTAWLMVTGAAVASGALWFFSDLIVRVLFGDQYAGAGSVLRTLSAVPALIAISNYAGVIVLFAHGEFVQPAVCQAIVAVMSLMWLIPLIQHSGALGAGQSVLVSEFLIMIGFLLLAKVHGYFP